MTQTLSVSSSQSSFHPSTPYRPLCAGHRGYKGRFPENTLESMRRAVADGADIIETDIQVAGDGVIVVTHDPNTQRCFGMNFDITSTPYKGVLEDLAPLPSHNVEIKDKMPTFDDLLHMLITEPAFAKSRLMLDIKRTNEPWVIPRIVEQLQAHNPDMEFWARKMVLGIWRLDVLTAAENSCPEIPVLHIGISQILARRFLKHPQVVGISLNYIALNVSGGPELIQEAHQDNRLVYSWTINTMPLMQWAVASKLDGIVTDYPDRFHAFMQRITDEDIKNTYSVVSPTSFHPLIDRVKVRMMFLLMWMWASYVELMFFLTPIRKCPY